MNNPNKALFDAKRLIAQIVTDVVNLEDINCKLEFNQTMIKYYDYQDFNLLFTFMWSCIPEHIKNEYNL